MPGPPPKPAGQRRRRNPTVATTRLPAAGRAGAPPKWPLSKHPMTRNAKAETEMWAREWRRPQAVAWEELDCERAVARYVRLSVEADLGLVNAALLAEIRQLEDRLGLSPMAMLRLRWEIVDEQAVAEAAEPDQVLDIRARLAAVE